MSWTHLICVSRVISSQGPRVHIFCCLATLMLLLLPSSFAATIVPWRRNERESRPWPRPLPSTWCEVPCSRSLLGWTTLTDFFSLPGGPRQGKLLLPEEPDPLHHPSRTRKYLPYYICFFHQVWKESLGKNLFSGWVTMGGPP